MDHRMGGSDVDRANPPLVLKDEPAELVSSLLGTALFFIFSCFCGNVSRWRTLGFIFADLFFCFVFWGLILSLVQMAALLTDH